MQQKLSVDTLGDLDGGAARLVIDAAIRTVIADLDDRGHDEKPREVIIKLTMRKMENGQVLAEVKAQAKVPEFRTAETVGIVQRESNRSVVAFQSFSPRDPNQRTFDELEEKQ